MNRTKDSGKLHEQVVQSPSSVLLLHHCPPSAHLYGHPRGLLQPDSRVLQMGQFCSACSGYKLKVGSSCTKTEAFKDSENRGSGSALGCSL